MSARPPWVKYWPRHNTDARCGVCGETDEWKLRYYVAGFRCDDHKPGR